MKITSDQATLRVSDLRELHDLQAGELVRDLRAALTPDHAAIEFDLSHLRAIHCATVDVLLAIHEELGGAGARFTWRVLNPPPELRQLFELVRLHHLFEIAPPRSPNLVPL